MFDTLVVRAVDRDTRRPESGLRLSWTVATGAGTVTILDSLTSHNGLARAQWRLGAGGTNQLRVSTLDQEAAVTFTTAAEAFTVDRLAANGSTGCGLRDGSLWCWGEGYGTDPLGPSDRQRPGWSNTSPVALPSPQQFVDLSLSGRSLCALDTQHSVWCVDSSTTQLEAVQGLPPLQMLTAAPTGHVHCGLAVTDSRAWCFVPDSAPPAPVQGDLSFTTIRVYQWGRFYEGCGLLADSTAACWATGYSTAGPSVTRDPLLLPGNLRFIDLAQGRGFACGRTSANALYCWGSRVSPLLGYAPVLAVDPAGPIGAFDDWIQVIPSLTQWSGFQQLTPTGQQQPIPAGLEGLLLDSYAKSVLTCIQTIDHQVYCLDRFFTGSSVLSVVEYGPVSPVVVRPE